MIFSVRQPRLWNVIVLSMLIVSFNACNQIQQNPPSAQPVSFSTAIPQQSSSITTSTASATSTASPTPTTPAPPTPTQTSRPTRTPTLTPTSEPASILVRQDSTCLYGPGIVYGIRTYLSAGERPPLFGMTSTEDWFAVEVEALDTVCWLPASVLEISGDLHAVTILTPQPTPTPEPTPTERLRGLKYYLIALGAGGPFGCGDGLVYFFSGKPETGNLEADIKSALNSLFKLKTKDVGGYYNPVYNAHLHVTRVDFDPATGRAEIYLAGAIPKPPDVCESKRIHDAVWATAEQFPAVKDARLWVGPHLLGDLIAVGDR